METDLVQSLVSSKGLKPCGETINTEYFALDDDILVAVPRLGASDDGETARRNVEMQSQYFRERGKRGAVIVFFDRMKSQDKDARKAYQDMSGVLVCTAMVGGSMLTRAMVSFLIGLARPETPISLFGTFDAAVAWCREMTKTRDRTLRGAEPRP